MKYIITTANDRVLNRRVYVSDPNTTESIRVPPNATVHEVEDAVGDAVSAVVEGLEVGEYATFDGSTASVVRAVDAVIDFPFMRQLRTVLRGVTPQRRAALHGVIGPSMALDDIDAAIAALTAYDATGHPARVQQLKADVLIVFGRESARRAAL